MSDIQKPTIGRIVHFVAVSNDDVIAADVQKEGKILPAIVTNDWESLTCDLSVFTTNPTYPVIVGKDIPYKSEAEESQSYWMWPEIKR